MNTSSIAIAAITVTSLAQTGTLAWLGHRAIDRARLVSPPKQQAQDKGATVEPIATVRRTGT